MNADSRLLTSTCGAKLFYCFNEYGDFPIQQLSLGGAKLACAGFVDTPLCKEAYDELKQKFNIVYQSTPRLNRNSGRQFFFVVYDGKRK